MMAKNHTSSALNGEKPSLTAAEALSGAKRIVIKVGSALICSDEGTADTARLDDLAGEMARLHGKGLDIILVTSGSIALGKTLLGLKPPLRLDEKQAAAASGQMPLMAAWQDALRQHGLGVAQILLTLEDTEDRKRYLNARATIETLLGLGVIPIVNENDTTATAEIRYGDNDRLGAHTAQMSSADLLVLLSDIDGLYSANPQMDKTAKHIPVVEQITSQIEASASGPNQQAGVGSGGMATKLAAARIATRAGTGVIIANGHEREPLTRISNQQARSTYFPPTVKAIDARRSWIAGRQKPAGTIMIDKGAASALVKGSSLLPAGVTQVIGTFSRGDVITVSSRGASGAGASGAGESEIAIGLAAYSSEEVDAIRGAKSDAIESILGYRRRPSIIHRDDLVLLGAPSKPDIE